MRNRTLGVGSLEVNKMTVIILLGLTCLTMGIIGCAPGSLDEHGLREYVQDSVNGLSKEKVINGVKLVVSYKPNDLIVQQELLGVNEISKEDIQQLTEKYKDYIYFILSISKDDQEILNSRAKNKREFGSMVNNLAFEMEQNVYMTNSNQEEVMLIDYIYPRTFGIGNSTTILFAFKSETLKGMEWVKFHLKDFGIGTGDCGFKFKTKDLLKTPQLIFN